MRRVHLWSTATLLISANGMTWVPGGGASGGRDDTPTITHACTQLLVGAVALPRSILMVASAAFAQNLVDAGAVNIGIFVGSSTIDSFAAGDLRKYTSAQDDSNTLSEQLVAASTSAISSTPARRAGVALRRDRAALAVEGGLFGTQTRRRTPAQDCSLDAPSSAKVPAIFRSATTSRGCWGCRRKWPRWDRPEPARRSDVKRADGLSVGGGPRRRSGGHAPRGS